MSYIVRGYLDKYQEKILDNIKDGLEKFDCVRINDYVSSYLIEYLESEGFLGQDLIDVYLNNIDQVYLQISYVLKDLNYKVEMHINKCTGKPNQLFVDVSNGNSKNGNKLKQFINKLWR